MAIAEYERRSLESSMAELHPLIDPSIFLTLCCFYQAADTYGQMDVLKDFTPSIKQK